MLVYPPVICPPFTPNQRNRRSKEGLHIEIRIDIEYEEEQEKLLWLLGERE